MFEWSKNFRNRLRLEVTAVSWRSTFWHTVFCSRIDHVKQSEMLKPRSQTGLEAKNLTSASASSFWSRPRPRNSLASASRQDSTVWLSTTARHRSFRSQRGTDELSKQRLRYITYINSDTFDHSSSELAKLYCDFSVYSPCLIDCFASRQALIQSREFSRRAV